MTLEPSMPPLPEHVRQFVRGQTILTLATATRDGHPHATTLIYAGDDQTFYFWIRPDTTTARNIEENPNVSLTIDDYNPDWSKIRGLQGNGRASVILNPGELDLALSLFREKFPDVIEQTRSVIQFYRIVPSRLNYIDNSGTGGAEGPTQSFDIEFHGEVVHNVFRELPRKEVDTLVGELETVEASPGEVIVRQGTPGEKFFIIVDGEVEVVREDDGDERPVAVLTSGQFFGEMAILEDIPRTATVRAVSHAKLLAMHRDMFQHLVAQSLATTDDFDRIVRERMRELKGD